MRFIFFCGLYLTLFSYCRKCKWVFLEKIPVLETQDTNGNLVRKCRTKEHCCWHIERLLARNATLITDSAKCYGPIGNAWRPDITALDCNHSVGFATPGPKSLQLGYEEGQVSSNLVEGVQNGLYKLGRQFLGYKIGSGTDVHEGRVKDFLVFTMNMNLNDRDVLQELFLVLRYLYGSMHVTSYEQAVCDELLLVAGNPPDYKKSEEEFEAFDLQADPWVPKKGPKLPELYKEFSTMPENFEAAWFSLIDKRTEAALSSTTGDPPSHQPTRAQLADMEGQITAGLLERGLAALTPIKQTRKKNHEHGQPNKKKQRPAPVPRLRVGVGTQVRIAPFFGIKEEPKEEPKSTYERSPPGGAVSFHPRLLTRVIDENGRRQRRLSEVGLSRGTPDPKEETSAAGAARDPKEETSAAGEARTPTRRLQWPESEYKDGSPLVDLTEGPLVDLTNTPRRSPPRFLYVPLPPLVPSAAALLLHFPSAAVFCAAASRPLVGLASWGTSSGSCRMAIQTAAEVPSLLRR